MSEYSRDIDDLHGDTVVATIEIKLRRNGAMSVAGQIQDEHFAMYMLDTARDTLKNHHNRLRAGDRLGVLVPAYDTALAGQSEEKILQAVREEFGKTIK